jgi:hypothetical protein
MIKFIIYRLTFLGLFMFLSSSSCDKSRYDFPYVPINRSIQIVTLESMIPVGGYAFMYDNEGVNGLLIRRNFEGQYFVYDRTCTYEPDYSCKVGEDSTSTLHVSCPCCESQYFLDETGDAFVTKGPSRYPLIRYNAVVNGGFLRVYN